ncbi:hypothetical protein [Roseiterribacter gracilis]|uniref:Uncharacterized protein n=1 Tax=Roseiterribacter gracilis TaxID=2812848 RepID=A0A8S8XA41_9PROT|nr:hypothetical protein TMPK1_04440 [Rhodospirillales bacterium TMPK1]
MSLAIRTFTHDKAAPLKFGGETLFKALGHPLVAPLAAALLARLEAAGPVAFYDPDGHLESFEALYPLAKVQPAGFYVQRLEELGRSFRGAAAQPIDTIADSGVRTILLASFDGARHVQQIRHLLPQGATLIDFDAIKLPAEMLSNPQRYLDPTNFATNFALLLEDNDLHTRIVGSNYWSGYGATDPSLWCRLYDKSGKELATWNESLPGPHACWTLDSAEIRKRFGLGAFEGSLFIHAVRIKGHGVVKYAVDTYNSAGTDLSATHDANAWPADYYAGLPAPAPGERVRLWVQNSHPVSIPAGGIGFARMGSNDVAWHNQEIAPFACEAIDVASLLPNLKWPDQIEVHAGRHFVRPRYTIDYNGQNGSKGRTRIAHANVERVDLEPDANLPKLPQLGRGFLLPFPILPHADFTTEILPTPMARGQSDLPLALDIFAADGTKVAETFLGKLDRADSLAVAIGDVLNGSMEKLGGYGHAELRYDFRDGGGGDGWLHAIARYRRGKDGAAAETSFGSHIYNIAVTYRDEPQSYTGAPPGLTTRLFLRIGGSRADTMCHLIYPASKTWHPESTTSLNLFDGQAKQIASRDIKIACGGSHHFRVRSTFTADELARAGEHGYVQVRDVTCRLFGFHGLINDASGFSLDHMFGF